jgi:hypothetical protein
MIIFLENWMVGIESRNQDNFENQGSDDIIKIYGKNRS